MTTDVLILPGLHNSGPAHWQSRWELAHPAFLRVQQKDWQTPACEDWVRNLEAAVAQHGPEVVLVGHSLACSLIGHWASRTRLRVRGALLVAPSDVAASACPPEPKGFQPMPLARLPFPSIVVTSENDPFVALERARQFAAAWGSEFVTLGRAGHINAESGHGDWPMGLELLDRLRRGVKRGASNGTD